MVLQAHIDRNSPDAIIIIDKTGTRERTGQRDWSKKKNEKEIDASYFESVEEGCRSPARGRPSCRVYRYFWRRGSIRVHTCMGGV